MTELDKVYSPHEIEDKWYKTWEDNHYFRATLYSNKPNYSIVIPPPNITGILHMGHVLTYSIQDVLVRWKRMSGYNTLFLPGTDHAGIATQNRVEKQLAKEGLKKEDIGRDKFVEKTWKWKEKHGQIITNQLRKLGASLDWEKERFTMDEGLSDSVSDIFIKLYNDGLIYQGEYMVNWCPRCGTALADDEVVHMDRPGKLWHIKYKIKDSDEVVIIATTRPETMLGDTGVAVHPDDIKYKHLIGKTVILPLVGRELPIIADKYVDIEFGTGILKITPAHDPNDFIIGKKHNLKTINILTPDAKINELGGKYSGMNREEARNAILSDLEKLGAIEKIKDNPHSVGQCYRCDTIIEPRISNQWFVNMKSLAKKALEVVQNGDIKIMPKRWEKVYYNWLLNIKDWCVSRQIWWGHRIPAYYGPDKFIFAAKSYEEAKEKAFAHYGKKVVLVEETDVLDTWFSSGLWPFSTMGWPEKTELLDKFYPTNTLVTGADIIFFWVARMVMMGMYEMKEIPFQNVFLHGMVRDENGNKMSKSLGNSPDPLDLIDRYGADAIRFTMIYNTSQGQDVYFSEKSLEMGRNFANKIWNVSRFVLMNLEDFDINKVDKFKLKLELVDRWIESKLQKTAKKVKEFLDRFALDEAAKSIYEFIRGDFCDWYVEISKIRLYGSEDKLAKTTAQYILWTILENGLKLLHPFMPFLTEEIWQKLGAKGKTIMLEEFPTCDSSLEDRGAEESFDYLQNVVSAIRNIRAEINISPGKGVKVILKTKNAIKINILNYNKHFLIKLANLDSLDFGDIEKPTGAAFRVVKDSELYIPLSGLLNPETEIKKINLQIEKIKKELVKVNGKLSNEKFVSKAPVHILNREKKIQKEYQDKLDKLSENLTIFKKDVKK